MMTSIDLTDVVRSIENEFGEWHDISDYVKVRKGIHISSKLIIDQNGSSDNYLRTYIELRGSYLGKSATLKLFTDEITENQLYKELRELAVHIMGEPNGT
jgi:hypothetical protein